MGNDQQPPQQPPPELLMHPEVAAMLGMLRALVPPDVPDDQIVRMLEHVLTKQQGDLDKVVEGLLDPNQIKTRPAWGIVFSSKTGQKFGPFLVNKMLKATLGNPDQMGQWACTFGALTSPLVRAVFLLHSWQISFVEMKAPVRLITPP